MGRRRAVPSKGRSGQGGRRVADAPEAAGDDGEFTGDPVWPDDLPARDINEDLEELDADAATVAAAAEARSDADPAAPDPTPDDPGRSRASDPRPQAEASREPDDGARPDLFDDRGAGTPEPSRRGAAPRGPRGPRKKAGTAVQLELWPDHGEPGPQGEG